MFRLKNTSSRRKQKNNNKEHDYDKWIKMNKKIREEDITRRAQNKNVAKFLKHVLPTPPTVVVPKFERKLIIFESRERTPPVKQEVGNF
jgi:hypothetical protein